jgi:hypothetical protein
MDLHPVYVTRAPADSSQMRAFDANRSGDFDSDEEVAAALKARAATDSGVVKSFVFQRSSSLVPDTASLLRYACGRRSQVLANRNLSASFVERPLKVFFRNGRQTP